jgi:hypothetical protein
MASGSQVFWAAGNLTVPPHGKQRGLVLPGEVGSQKNGCESPSRHDKHQNRGFDVFRSTLYEFACTEPELR